MKTKDKVLYATIIILILFILFGGWYARIQQNKLYEEIRKGNEIIVNMDQTKKEDDGQYAKLVDYFNTEKELNQQIKDENKELQRLIKKQNEKLLMVNNAIISLKSEISQGEVTVNQEDSTVFDLNLKYPNSNEAFIKWDGSVFTQTETYEGEWSFGKLPLDIVLTETERGLWNSRLIGPDWLLVDSIKVNSLPPEEFDNSPKESKFGILLGGGYINSFDQNGSNGLSIGAGLNWKNHSLLINGTTNKEIGFSYYYKFGRLKKNK